MLRAPITTGPLQKSFLHPCAVSINVAETEILSLHMDGICLSQIKYHEVYTSEDDYASHTQCHYCQVTLFWHSGLETSLSM